MQPAKIYEFPHAITGMRSDPKLTEGLRRVYKIICDFEYPEEQEIILTFNEVWAYRCTHYTAIDPVMVTIAYGEVVDLGSTDWLRSTLAFLRAAHTEPQSLKHIATCFDDGPLYEFLCGSVEVTES